MWPFVKIFVFTKNLCLIFEFLLNLFNVNKQKESSSVKGRKQLVQRGRYGYETLEDKYKFCHYEDLEKYIEEYRDMFCVANRGHKKGWKPNGISYNYLRMAPPARYVIV